MSRTGVNSVWLNSSVLMVPSKGGHAYITTSSSNLDIRCFLFAFLLW